MSTVEEDAATQFGTVDYVVVVIVLAISSAIGKHTFFVAQLIYKWDKSVHPLNLQSYKDSLFAVYDY